MIFISIGIIGLEAYFKVKNYQSILICLDIVSILYSVIFIQQEIPILSKDEKILMGIVNKINDEKLSKNFKEGKESFGYDFDQVLTYLILNKGINKVYLSLKTNVIYKNNIFLDHLLDLTINQFQNYLDEYKKINEINDLDKYETIIHNIAFINDDLVKIFQNKEKIFEKINIEETNIINSLVNLTLILKSLIDKLKINYQYDNSTLMILESLTNLKVKDGKYE